MTSLVSIILPVYNGATYLSEAITSVIEQTYESWELLIINDGSTDGSDEVARSFSDDRIRYFEQVNKGVSAARNVGLEAMKGEYFCFLDADDLLTPNSLKDRVKVLDTQPAVHFVDGTIELYDSEMAQLVETRQQTFSGAPLKALLNIDTSCFFGPTWMIKRAAGKTYHFKEGLTHGEDLLFYMSIANQGHYAAISKITYQYRTGNDSAMTNLDGLWQGYQTIYQELSTHFKLTRKELNRFKRRIASIMFKSYLGNGKVLAAIKLVLLDYPRL